MVEKYDKWLRLPAQKELRARMIRELTGKTLVCCCKPYACHGDVILKMIESVVPEKPAEAYFEIKKSTITNLTIPVWTWALWGPVEWSKSGRAILAIEMGFKSAKAAMRAAKAFRRKVRHATFTVTKEA